MSPGDDDTDRMSLSEHTRFVRGCMIAIKNQKGLWFYVTGHAAWASKSSG